jgi:hypothetical protein
MLYVDGMNAVMNQNEVVQWLYSLVESSVRKKIFSNNSKFGFFFYLVSTGC